MATNNLLPFRTVYSVNGISRYTAFPNLGAAVRHATTNGYQDATIIYNGNPHKEGTDKVKAHFASVAKRNQSVDALTQLASVTSALVKMAAKGKVTEDHKIELAQAFASVASALNMIPGAATSQIITQAQPMPTPDVKVASAPAQPVQQSTPAPAKSGFLGR